MTDIYKVKCSECGKWKGTSAEQLVAPNPFDHTEIIVGCPLCKQVETMVMVCDEPECWKPVSCGFPTPWGYRQTCGDHYQGWLVKVPYRQLIGRST